MPRRYGYFVEMLLLLVGLTLALMSRAQAQQGENAVYNSLSAVAGSTAFIDASAFCVLHKSSRAGRWCGLQATGSIVGDVADA